MPNTGIAFKNAIKIYSKLHNTRNGTIILQDQTLRKLLFAASPTEFGKQYDFKTISESNDVVNEFQKHVPVFDYNKIFDEWWFRLLRGEKNVTWPGKIAYFALSSGTTGSPSKHIPISHEMLLSIRRAGLKHACTLKDLKIPRNFFDKEMLMLGGSTSLKQFEHGFKGDLSGILTRNFRSWMNKIYRPGQEISRIDDWNEKLDIITHEAHKWDIGIITGVPAWVQILIEKIITYYGLSNIHEIWPNFKVYAHGGVSIHPYLSYFDTLLGQEIFYLNTYLASEGFIAFEKYGGNGAMTLAMKNGIFYEFIPFNSDNFSIDGKLFDNAKALNLDELSENVDYALVLSTNAGAWRYLIGDTIKFTNLNKLELIITGRTSQFLSLCGEHLSIANMNDAISKLNIEMNLSINEFTVIGERENNYFAHNWWLGTNSIVDTAKLSAKLDSILCTLNDDYKTERSATLKNVRVNIVSNNLFYEWMQKNNKIGGSHKFPRVLLNEQAESWRQFLKLQNTISV